jgi:hypothetical protein
MSAFSGKADRADGCALLPRELATLAPATGGAAQSCSMRLHTRYTACRNRSGVIWT